MDLFTAAAIAEIVGGVTVVAGVAFAVVQVREFRRQQRHQAIFAFIQGWSATTSLRHLDLVYALPDAAPPEEVARRGPGTVEAAYATYLRIETLGILVHERIVRLDQAEEFMGGVVRVAWRKLRPWIEEKRRASGSERPGEWFQWLAERLAERPARSEGVGAHEAHRAWRP